MKKSVIHSGILTLMFIIFYLMPNDVTLAQEQTAIQGHQKEEWTLDLPRLGLTSIQMVTVRPTLSNCGKGLLHYDCIFVKDQDRMYIYKYRGDEKPVVVKANFTEADLETLKYNELFIDKQYQIQLKKWIRKEKMDLNLGEVIKGFYMKPIF